MNILNYVLGPVTPLSPQPLSLWFWDKLCPPLFQKTIAA
jgi:hypothetical protein